MLHSALPQTPISDPTQVRYTLCNAPWLMFLQNSTNHPKGKWNGAGGRVKGARGYTL